MVYYLVITPLGVFYCIKLSGNLEEIMAKNTINDRITLACTECKERNYATTKNKKNDPERIELNKFCKRCGKHTLHKETK